MDYRLISTLEGQAGWKALSEYIDRKTKEIEKSLIQFSGIHNEAGRLVFSKLQAEHSTLLELKEIVENPQRVSQYFESDLPNW